MGFELVRGLAYERLQHSAELSPRLGQLLDAGMSVGADAYDAALAETAAARAGLDGFFGPCEAMLVPAAPGEAPAGLGYTGNPVFSRMWTLLGVPCVTLPAIWGDGRAADRDPARRPARSRCAADGGGAVRRARAGRGGMTRPRRRAAG